MSNELEGRRNAREGRRCLRTCLPAIAACSALTLVAAPAWSFRTGEDSPALSGRGRLGWKVEMVPFSLATGQRPNGLTEAQIEDALARAIETWSTPECSRLKPYFSGWTDVEPQGKDGENSIAWVDDWAERGLPADAPGNADVQYRGSDQDWEIAEADLYLNASDFEWSNEGEAPSLEAVLTHELGHALGLLHPCEPEGEDGAPACENASSDVEATTMFPFYDAAGTSLSEDDIAGLCYLYPIDPECSDCGRNEVCVEGECRAECNGELCEDGAVCGFWGCTPEDACLERDCVGQACDSDVADSCGPLATCRGDVCVGGGRSWGDSCSSGADCADGACVERVCQPLCLADQDCGAGTCAVDVGGLARGCLESGAYERGSRCALGEDCESGICILTEEGNKCTSSCDDSSSCPADWACKPVDKQKVCVPPAPSEGCGVSQGRGPQGPSGWILVAAAVLATRKRQRRNVS